MNGLLTAAGWLATRLGEHSSKVGFLGLVGGAYSFHAATTSDAKAAALYTIVMGALAILVPNNKG